MVRPLPQAIDRFLQEYIRQRNKLLFWRGLAMMVIVVIGWVALWSLTDRVERFGSLFRGMVLLGTLVGLGAWLISLLRGTLLAKIDANKAALELELLRPELDERLATVCSRLGDADEQLASPQLLDAIARQLEEYVNERGMPRLVSFRSVGRYATCAAILVVVALVLAIVPTFGFSRLLGRFAAPWSHLRPVSTTELLPRVPPDGLDLREAEAFVLNVAAVRAGEDGVVLHFNTDGKVWDSQSLRAIGPGEYQTVLGPVNGNEQFFLTSGDAVTDVIAVRLLKRPAVAEFRIRYEYPAYMQREPLLARNVDGLIEAPVGTKATVQVVSTEKLKAAAMEGPGLSLPLKPTIEQSVMEGTITLTKDTPYVVKMVSAKGIDGKGPADSQIRALPDRPPFVQLISPSDDQRISPRDILSVHHQAIDDYGLTRYVIRLQVNNAQPLDMPIKLGADLRRREGQEELDMANLGLKVGDIVAVSLAAKDVSGQETTSETRYLFISPHSVSTADYTRLSELQRSAELSKELEKDVTTAIQSMDQARASKQDPGRQAEATTAYEQGIADSGQQAESLRQSLMRAIARSQDPRMNDALSAMADRTQVRMIEAHDLIDELGQGDAREQNAHGRLERSVEQTRQMREQLQALVTAEKAAAALADTRNTKAAEQAQQSGRMTARATEMLGRMKQDAADQTRQLGLNPDDANVEKQLEAKVQAGNDQLAKAKDVDLIEAAQAWSSQLLDDKVHPPMFDRRLSAAADVESVRPDGNFQRASDLNLAARASQALWLASRDPANRSDARKSKGEFVQAFADLEKQSRNPDDQGKASAAREKMAKWAGDSESAAGPADNAQDDAAMRETAMETNQQMANRRYERASELQKRLAMAPDQAADATRDLNEARAADELSQAQDALRRQLSASDMEATALAQRQREVAGRIEAQMQQDQTAVPGTPHDTRKDALAAIRAVQERLARMPQQLQEVQQSADVQIQAHELSQKAAQDAQNAPPDRKAAARRAADRAGVAETDAVKQTTASITPVDPDVAKVMSASLADFLPETNGASQVLEKKLQPSLQKVKQNAQDNKAADMLRGIQQSREAIAEAQAELRNAQESLLDQDPLFAAKVYADAAAEALSKHPPDVQGAAANQKLAAQSLGKQWSQSVHGAAVAHLSSSSQFRKLYDDAAAGAGKPGGSELASNRQWGQLRERQQTDITAAAREEDPSGYQRMLQVYFRTLGKAREQEKK